MRHLTRAWAALALFLFASPVLAAGPFPAIVGPSRDGSLHDLQRKIDKLVGFGRIDVNRDYIGARPGDPDPWYWVNLGTKPITVQLVDRKSPRGTLGWYADNGRSPVIDGVDDGVVVEEWKLRGSRTSVRLPATVRNFGFYVDYKSNSHGSGTKLYRYFSNRMLNDCGPEGAGAMRAPYDGDPQMLVYDASRWLGPDTYIVACEYSDSGCPIGNGEEETDNDYSDMVYIVSGLGTTPAKGASFARVKAMFR